MQLLLSLLLSWIALASPLSTYELKNPGIEELYAVSRIFEVARLEHNSFEIYVPSSQAGTLHLLAPRATLREFDTALALRRQLDSYRGLNSNLGYRSWVEVQAWMQTMAEAHPELAELVAYGETSEKKPLLALRLSNRANKKAKPAIMLTAATHGDEVITTEVLIALAERLLTSYGQDSRLSAFLDDKEIYVIPVVNPDGFASRNRYETDRDPNRSYPYPDRPSQTPTPAIAGLMRLFHEKNMAGTLDFHAYGEMVMYPWAYTYEAIDAPTADRFHRLTGSMAANNGYAFGPISEVIYIAPGSSADYYFWKLKSTSLAIEIGRSKAPRPEQIPAYIESQAESTWRFLESF